MDPYHGEDPIYYKIEFYVNSSLVATEVLKEIDESSRYSIQKSGLTPGKLHLVKKYWSEQSR